MQAELAELAKTQAEMDKMRKEENEEHLVAKADLEMGIAGVTKALEVLTEYYGSAFLQGASAALVQQPHVPEYHEPAKGAGGGIIDILEVVESDMSAELAHRTTEEQDAQALQRAEASLEHRWEAEQASMAAGHEALVKRLQARHVTAREELAAAARRDDATRRAVARAAKKFVSSTAKARQVAPAQAAAAAAASGATSAAG